MTVAALVGAAGCSGPATKLAGLWCGTFGGIEYFKQSGVTLPGPISDVKGCMGFYACNGNDLALSLGKDCVAFATLTSPTAGTIRVGTSCNAPRPDTMLSLVSTAGAFSVAGDGTASWNIDWSISGTTATGVGVGGDAHWLFTKYAQSPGAMIVDDPNGGMACAGGAGVDLGSSATDYAALVGCDATSIVDLTAPAAVRTVAFGGAAGAMYSPSCIHIAVGQQVNFKGDFDQYDIDPGVPGQQFAGSPGNPIMHWPIAGIHAMKLDVNFPVAGDYLFYNKANVGAGMKGMVRVK